MQMLKHNYRNGFFCFLLRLVTSVRVKANRQSTAGFWREKYHLVIYYSQGLSWPAFWCLLTLIVSKFSLRSWITDWAERYTEIRSMWVSVKFGTCTVVSVNWTLVEDKMSRFKGECELFSFNKCPISPPTTVQVPNFTLTHMERITV